jgi:small ligand-binding sensory domain FIST
MMRAGSSLAEGTGADVARAAAREAADGLGRPSLAFVFVSGHDEEELGDALDGVDEVLGGAPVVGCTGGGVVGSTGEVEGEPAISVLAIETDPGDVDLAPFFLPLTGEGPRDADALAKKLEGRFRGQTERSALVLLPDPFVFDAKPLLARFREKLPKLPVVGGLAASNLPKEAPVFAGSERAGHAAAGALISGPRLRATVAVAQGCRPILEASKVTRSERNLVFELDGAPAIHRLRAALEAAQSSGGDLFCGLGLESFSSPLASGSDFLARNILGADPKTGAVVVGEMVPQGSTICFLVRDADAAREDLAARVTELKAAYTKKPAAFGLYFDCLGRGAGLYGESGVDASIIRETLGDIPLAGFFGNGELAPFLGTNLVHNYTGVLVLVGET